MRGITPSILGKKVRCPDCDKTSRLSTDPYAAGRIIGDFIIQRRLGVGSIGAVYFAHQISLDRPVALKVLSEEYTNAKGIEAFLKEARAAARLSHSNLVQAFGVGAEDNACFMAMSFIEGETVKDKIKREGKIQVDEALHIAQQVAEGLFFAWSEAGLIHRDIKPENIMLTKDGTVKLTDLGLAITEREWHPDMEISGSPSYMSPEQFTGEKLDTRSDIYSLGVSLYQMLSGKLPFTGATLKTVARQHFYEAAKPLNKLAPMIPAKVDALVQKMMAKNPDDRFANMEELLKAIWEVRQSTAPDKELVPSVHTISIKRLDYGLQEISKERQKIMADGKKQEQKTRDIIFRSLAIGVPFLALLSAMFFFMASGHREKELAEGKRVDAVGKAVRSLSSDKEHLEVSRDIDQLVSELSDPRSDFERELRTRLELYRALLDNRKLAKKVRELESDSVVADKNLRKLISDNEELSMKLREMEIALDKREQEWRQKVKGLLAARADNESGKSNKTAGADRHTASPDTSDETGSYWKDCVRRKGIFFPVVKSKFAEARAYLEVMAMKHPNDTVWFDELMKMVDDLERLQKALTLSGTKYAGVQLREGKVKSILGGKIEYVNGNITGTVTWRELSPKSVEAIAVSVFPNLPPKRAKALAALFRGDAARAADLAGSDSEFAAIRDAVCEYRLDLIRIHRILDTKRAKEEAIAFLRDMASSPETQARYKAILKKMFSEE